MFANFTLIVRWDYLSWTTLCIKTVLTSAVYKKHKRQKWTLFSNSSNELTKDFDVDGRNVNNVVRKFNTCIIKAVAETIRGQKGIHTVPKCRLPTIPSPETKKKCVWGGGGQQ